MNEQEAAVEVKSPEDREKQVIAKSTCNEFVKEAKQISSIFMPMLIVTASDYSLRFLSTLMVGHVGKLYFSGAVISTSITNVTGFSFIVSFMFYPFQSSGFD